MKTAFDFMELKVLSLYCI